VIHLGPFALTEPAGQGGMAQVWRASYGDAAISVAVKVISLEKAKHPRFLASFRNEVRAVAGLDHRHVVMVFDHGSISAEAEEASRGRLIAGSPYLAMEWASGGTLSQTKVADWDELRDTLLALLDALGHAHARGLVHRDLKPANVLRCTDDDLRPGLKLADFGVARPPDDASEEPSAGVGTAAYMAPEQAAGRHSDEGPWTDLYSLGCLAFRLATGAPPFVRDTVDELLQAHLADPVPEMQPRFGVPLAFQDWIETLLQKNPAHRFARAADAAWSLRELDSPTHVSPEPKSARRETAEDAPTQVSVPHTTPFEKLRAVERAFDELARAKSHPVPGMPHDWRPAHEPLARSKRLLGTGLGLYGLRSVGFVDRESERDHLWNALSAVRDSRRARAVFLEGPPGFGKSRLAEWLCQRALEVGAATVLEATHDAQTGIGDGLGPMLARHFQCLGRTRSEMLGRIERRLRMLGAVEVDEWVGLTELVSPSVVGDRARAPRWIRFGSANERYEVVRRYLHRLAEDRPVIVRIEDAQHARDTIGFVEHLLEAQEHTKSAILVIATTRDDREDEVALLGRDDVERIEVGALAEEHWPQLVREILGLEGELAARVEQRAAGNPQFAVQLVGDWVQRGLLRSDAHGFRLHEDARVDLPDGLHQIWAARVSELLAGRAEHEAIALELAAALGQDIDSDELRACCALAKLEVPESAIEAMLDRHLARSRSDEGDWAFAHAMLRESLLRRAAEHDRLGEHHRTCARMLSERIGPQHLERRGRHLLAAGDLEPALEPLFTSAVRRGEEGEYRIAMGLLADHDAALRSLGVSEDDPRWCETWVQRSILENQRGRVDEGERFATRAEDLARARDLPSLLGAALVARARASYKGGRMQDAIARCEEAIAVAMRVDDRLTRARASSWLGIVQLESGEAAASRASLETSLALFEELGDEFGIANSNYELGLVFRNTGDFDRARAHFDRAQEAAVRSGNRNGEANVIVAAAEIARGHGDFRTAEQANRKAMAMYQRVGSGNFVVAQANVALCLMAQGEYAAARPLLEDARVTLARGGWQHMLACVLVELLPCDMAASKLDAWDEHLAAARAEIARTNVFDADLAWAAELAARLAREAGEFARARDALELALAQHRALGNVPRVDAIERELSTLASS